MTQQELYDAWQRYMHRSDLSEDLDTVYLLTSQLIKEHVLMSVDLADILENAPRMFLHGGLTYLHELAQDDVGGQREAAKFARAAEDYAMRLSLDTTTVPQMENPYAT